MNSHYLVVVRSQLLDSFMCVRHTVGDQNIPVFAESPEAASRAAVAWLGDSHPVYRLQEQASKQLLI